MSDIGLSGVGVELGIEARAEELQGLETEHLELAHQRRTLPGKELQMLGFPAGARGSRP